MTTLTQAGRPGVASGAQYISLTDAGFGAVSGAADSVAALNAATAAAIAAGKKLWIPGGVWNWGASAEWVATDAVDIEIDPSAVMNYTGTGIALQMGPTGQVAANYGLARVAGGIWTGGATMAAGIQFQKYMVTCRADDIVMQNFGAGSGKYAIEGADENWDFQVNRPRMYITGAVAVNWINAKAAGGVNSTRLVVNDPIGIGNGLSSGVGIRLNGAGSRIRGGKIEVFSPNVQLGPLQSGGGLFDVYQENTAATNVPCIYYGETAALLDGFRIEDSYFNLHKSAGGAPDHPLLAPINAGAGLTNTVIERNRFADPPAVPIVKMNTAVTGQVTNSAANNVGYTTLCTPAVTGNGSVWAGTPSGLIVDTRWIAVQGGIGFQNSWANAGGHPPASYRLTPDGRHVELSGGVNGGAAGSIVFTLPAGYRPATLQMWVQANASTLVGQVVDVDTGGNLKIFGGVAANNQRIDAVFPLDI